MDYPWTDSQSHALSCWVWHVDETKYVGKCFKQLNQEKKITNSYKHTDFARDQIQIYLQLCYNILF